MEIVPRYRGKKIVLAPLDASAEAVAKYYRWMQNDSVLGFIGSQSQVTSLDMEKKWAEERSIQTDKSTYFGIYTSSEMNLIGTCSIVKEGTNGLLGIYIGEEEYLCHGYGKDAMHTLTKFALDEMGLHRCELHVDAGNERALKCYEAVGYKWCGMLTETDWYEGKWHDTVLMEIVVGEQE